mmetsp:Transcript_12620/g.27633  ORF Transcript_12620/g.27633 Transcript_12620/m.27633 type:complete len:87 (+) Transcript_12620:327-587(+)
MYSIIFGTTISISHRYVCLQRNLLFLLICRIPQLSQLWHLPRIQAYPNLHQPSAYDPFYIANSLWIGLDISGVYLDALAGMLCISP